MIKAVFGIPGNYRIFGTDFRVRISSVWQYAIDLISMEPGLSIVSESFKKYMLQYNGESIRNGQVTFPGDGTIRRTWNFSRSIHPWKKASILAIGILPRILLPYYLSQTALSIGQPPFSFLFPKGSFSHFTLQVLGLSVAMPFQIAAVTTTMKTLSHALQFFRHEDFEQLSAIETPHWQIVRITAAVASCFTISRLYHLNCGH